MALTNGRTDELLKELYQAGNDLLNDYPWEFEEDRWAELLVCSLMVGQTIPSETAREAVDALRKMDLASVEALSTLTPETSSFISKILVQLGADEQTAQASVRLLSSVANVVKAKWTGYVQRFLREQGQRMVNDLADALRQADVAEATSRKIALVWLQNVANIPVLSTSDAYVQSFCKEHELSEEELVNTADRLGLNVSVLDDLLALEALAASEAAPKKEPANIISAKAGAQS